MYRIVIIERNGKVTIGGSYPSLDDVRNAMLKLREFYADHGIDHYVDYMEV